MIEDMIKLKTRLFESGDNTAYLGVIMSNNFENMVGFHIYESDSHDGNIQEVLSKAVIEEPVLSHIAVLALASGHLSLAGSITRDSLIHNIYFFKLSSAGYKAMRELDEAIRNLTKGVRENG